MTKPRTFHWSSAAVLGLLLCDIALTVSGAVAALMQHQLTADELGGWRLVCIVAFAGVTGFALAVTQAAAGVAQYLHKRERRGLAEALAWACAVVCALVSVFGMQLAGGLLSGEETVRVDAGLLAMAGAFLAFVKPAMGVSLSACQDVSDLIAAAAEQAARDAEERSADANRAASIRRAEIAATAQAATPPAIAPATPTPALSGARPVSLAAARDGKKASAAKATRAARATAAGALVALSGAAAGQVAAAAPAAIERPAAEPSRPTGYTPSLDEIEQAREALHRRGVVPASRSVAAHIGCSRHAIDRVWPKGVPLAYAPA